MPRRCAVGPGCSPAPPQLLRRAPIAGRATKAFCSGSELAQFAVNKTLQANGGQLVTQSGMDQAPLSGANIPRWTSMLSAVEAAQTTESEF